MENRGKAPPGAFTPYLAPADQSCRGPVQVDSEVLTLDRHRYLAGMPGGPLQPTGTVAERSVRPASLTQRYGHAASPEQTQGRAKDGTFTSGARTPGMDRALATVPYDPVLLPPGAFRLPALNVTQKPL